MPSSALILTFLAGPALALVTVERNTTFGDDKDNDGKFDDKPWARETVVGED